MATAKGAALPCTGRSVQSEAVMAGSTNIAFIDASQASVSTGSTLSSVGGETVGFRSDFQEISIIALETDFLVKADLAVA